MNRPMDNDQLAWQQTKTLIKWILFGIVACVMVLIPACNFYSVTVEPNHEVVLIDRPYLIGHEGVRTDTVKEGRKYLWKSTLAQPVVMAPQTVGVAFDDFSSKDSILLDFQTSIQYRITNASLLIDKFGVNWFNNNVQAPYTSIVRQQVKEYSMSDIISNPLTSTKLDADITKDLNALVASIKLPVQIIGVSLGRAKPNENVLLQMNKTAAEQQRNKTLTATKISEDNRAEAESARARADNAYRNEMHMDTAQFIALEQAKLYAAACKESSHCIITSGQAPLVLPTTK